MSAPPTSLPAEIAELIWNTVVTWEQTTGVDGYGQQTYAAGKVIPCWVEGAGFNETGVGTTRFEGNATLEQTVRDPEVVLYFDGDNADARSFLLTDRFTINIPSTQGQVSLQPTAINTFYGPNFSNQYPWLIAVYP